MLYLLQVVIVKVPSPIEGDKPTKFVRIHLESLQRLATKFPAEYPMPAIIPDSHAEDVDANPGPGDKDDDGSSDEDDDEHDDDPDLVRIPEGYIRAPITACFTTVVYFMLWASVARKQARWHFGTVTKTYPPGFTFRRAPFTHDATLNVAPDVRGVNLTRQQQADGYWVHLVPKQGAPSSKVRVTAEPPSPTNPPPRAPGVRASSRLVRGA